MELFDTTWYGEPRLTRFMGGRNELYQRDITKSFKTAKATVLSELRARMAVLQEELAYVEKMETAKDVPLVDNPYS